jgi:hypothetical protein
MMGITSTCTGFTTSVMAPKPREKHSTGAGCGICLVFVRVFDLLLAVVCVVMLAIVFPVVLTLCLARSSVTLD